MSKWELRLIALGVFLVVFGTGGVVWQNIKVVYNIQTRSGVFSEYIPQRLSTLYPLMLPLEAPEYDLFQFIYSGLMRYNPETGEMEPDLAQTYSITKTDTGLQYSFTIRPDATWHDGRAVSLDDVAFTLSLMSHPSTAQSWKDGFAGITYEVNEETNTINIVFQTVDYLLLQLFQIPILPAHIFQHAPVEQYSKLFEQTLPVGSGPMRIIDVISAEDFDLIKLAPHTLSHRSLDLKIRSIHMYFSLRPPRNGQPAGMRSTTSYEYSKNQANTYTLSLPQYHSFFFNYDRIIPENSLVRQAMMSVFEQALADQKLALNLFHDSSHESLEGQQRDTRIKELLYNAGWQLYTQEFDDEIRRNAAREKMILTLFALNTPSLEQTVEKIIQIAKQMGVIIQVEMIDTDQFIDVIHQRPEYDILLLPIQLGYKNDMYSYLHSSQRNKYNLGNFYHLETDLLLEDFRMTDDLEKKERIKVELQKRYDALLPILLFEVQPYTYALTPEVVGYKAPLYPLTPKDRLYYIDQLSLAP